MTRSETKSSKKEQQTVDKTKIEKPETAQVGDKPKRFLPANKKPDSAVTFPEKVGRLLCLCMVSKFAWCCFLPGRVLACFRTLLTFTSRMSSLESVRSRCRFQNKTLISTCSVQLINFK